MIISSSFIVRVRVSLLSVSMSMVVVGVRSDDGRVGRTVRPGGLDGIGVGGRRLGVGVGVVGVIVIVVVSSVKEGNERETGVSLRSFDLDPTPPSPLLLLPYTVKTADKLTHAPNQEDCSPPTTRA